MIKKKRPPRRPVIRTDPATGEEIWYPSISEAAKSIGVAPSQVGNACMFGCQCHGYYWRKVDDDFINMTGRGRNLKTEGLGEI